MANNALVRIVVASGYPKACLTSKVLDRLTEEISKEIDALPREKRAPGFNDVFIRSVVIVAETADICLRDWLMENTLAFRLKEGLKLGIKWRSVYNVTVERPYRWILALSLPKT